MQYGAQQFFGGQQTRGPSPQQYLTYGGYTYQPTQQAGFDMSTMMNMMMMIMMMAIMMSMIKPIMATAGGR